MLESSELPGMNGLQARRETAPGNLSSANERVATGKVPSNSTSAKCGRPPREARVGPKPKLCSQVERRLPDSGPVRSPCRTRASTTSPPRSAFTAKWLKPLTLPLLGRLKISQSISRPLPASPIEPEPIPPSGNEISLSWAPR